MQILYTLFFQSMSYTSLGFFFLVFITLCLYYLFPKRIQWGILLFASILFYLAAMNGDLLTIGVFAATIIISYLFSLRLADAAESPSGRIILGAGIIISSIPLLAIKGNAFIMRPLLHKDIPSLIVPLGVSFYTLQMISYLVDIYRRKITPQRNFLKYALYISFFPHIMQGPIPRYEQLGDQFYEEHRFCPEAMLSGMQLILWGFFLKYMIADKAGVFVDSVFKQWEMYRGAFVLVAGILYSIQLYADFLACVSISKGIAELFGIKLAENFEQPYLATSVKDFWRRWHISLSSWLRDYVYIPLGGNRKGTIHKYLNLLITFLVSGAWHGSGYQFIVWGALHAIFQIIGEISTPLKARADRILGLKQGSAAETWCRRLLTFFFVMIAWIMFRAPSAAVGFQMILSIFTVPNYWVFWDNSLLRLGLSWKEWNILLLSIFVLFRIEQIQQSSNIRKLISEQPLFIRWALYLTCICAVIVFGSYGYGFNATDFIYRGF